MSNKYLVVQEVLAGGSLGKQRDIFENNKLISGTGMVAHDCGTVTGLGHTVDAATIDALQKWIKYLVGLIAVKEELCKD